MSLRGFVRSDGREQQLISAELFALMSSRQEEDYVQVSDQSYCRDILIHSTVIYLVPIYTLQCEILIMLITFTEFYLIWKVK